MHRLGRFQVNRKLGSGNQGTVYLCIDPKLERQVAIKYLDRPLASHGSLEQDLLREARAISRINHPNIVSIFDVGTAGGRPFLVFEYVEGELLSKSMAGAAMDLPKSLDIITGLLSGLDQVHSEGIIHRDLKPSNVILTKEGMPKIMDFGISSMVQANQMNEEILTGTPRYMPPEYISNGEVGTQTDIFALGAMFFEMLTGEYAFDGKDTATLFANIQACKVAVPSSLQPSIGQQLDAIVMKSLEKAPVDRFRDAGEFASALLEYRESDEGVESLGGGSQGTVEFLLRRMQHKSDFPMLSESIRTLNRLGSSEEDNINHISSVIIKDFALTNKILKVVNSAYYSHFAGKIGTVSRAIVVLGIKTIRSIAASLIFFEHLHNKAQATQLKDDIATAVFSATMARQLAEDASMESVEESFLCGMLHNLGRILVTYYLHDESEEIERLVKQQDMEPEAAQKKVLGISFEGVGLAVSKHWNFPEEITQGMVRVDPASPGNLKNSHVKIRLIASFANEAASILGESSDDKSVPIKKLLRNYRNGLAISERRFDEMVEQARREFRELGGSLVDANSKSPLLKRLVVTSPIWEGESPRSDAPDLTESLVLDPGAASGSSPEPVPADLEKFTPSPDAEVILTDGLREVSAMLLDEKVNLIQLFNVVIETVYRAMAFHRVVLCLQDVGRKQYLGRLGLGAGIEDFVASFRFPSQFKKDVFHAALKNDVDLYISETRDPRIASDLPGWYRKISDTGSFIIFPLVVNRKALGLIYADHPRAHGMDIPGRQLNLLKALRNQVVLAFRTRM
ncbi:MAG: HDOD domain-containing protein [Gammaproteobacteria bacterium]|nr:HDOD domain-containing protein [Gammaproteobacteria bacterium]